MSAIETRAIEELGYYNTNRGEGRIDKCNVGRVTGASDRAEEMLSKRPVVRRELTEAQQAARQQLALQVLAHGAPVLVPQPEPHVVFVTKMVTGETCPRPLVSLKQHMQIDYLLLQGPFYSNEHFDECLEHACDYVELRTAP